MALAAKDLKLLLRDRAGFFFVFFFPLIYAVFFGTIFSGADGDGGMGAMAVAVVDEDRSEASRAFVQKLADSDVLTVTRTSREEATDLVRRGRQAAYVLLPEGFGQAQMRILQAESIRIEVGVDPARKAEAGMLEGLLMRHAFEIIQELFMNREALRSQIQTSLESIRQDEEMPMMTRAVLGTFFAALDTFLVELPANSGDEASEGDQTGTGGDGEDEGLINWQPIKVTVNSVIREASRGPQTSFDITMPQAFVWMFLGSSAAFAVSLVTERTRGTLMRLRTAPITLAQILGGKALACFITIMAGLVLLFAFFWAVFGVRPHSYSLLALAFLASTVAFVGIMMLISVMGKTEASVGGFGWAFLIVMAMTGGGMLPLMFMPPWMQTVSDFSFVKWAVLAVEGAVWRQFSLAEMLLPCGILFGIGAVSFTAGVLVYRD